MLVETATRISLIVADCIIILVTRLVTHSHRRESLSRVFSTRMGIASVLYKYGMNLVSPSSFTSDYNVSGGIHFLCERCLQLYNRLLTLCYSLLTVYNSLRLLFFLLSVRMARLSFTRDVRCSPHAPCRSQ